MSAFTRLYGYESDDHPGMRSIYDNIGIYSTPRNHHGFYLTIDEDNSIINLYAQDPTTRQVELSAFWTFDSIRDRLLHKHPATLWFKARTREENGLTFFKYTDVLLSRTPVFSQFLSLINSGYIIYNWRGHVAPTGRYRSRNHGNAWRNHPSARALLFTDFTNITF